MTGEIVGVYLLVKGVSIGAFSEEVLAMRVSGPEEHLRRLEATQGVIWGSSLAGRC